MHCIGPENCVGNWTDAAAGCSVSCGDGTKSQTFHIVTPAAYGGTNCTAADLATQSVPCNLAACGVCVCAFMCVSTFSVPRRSRLKQAVLPFDDFCPAWHFSSKQDFCCCVFWLDASHSTATTSKRPALSQMILYPKMWVALTTQHTACAACNGFIVGTFSCVCNGTKMGHMAKLSVFAYLQGKKMFWAQKKP